MAGRGLAGAVARDLRARPGFGQGVGTVECPSAPLPRGGSLQTAVLQPVVSRESGVAERGVGPVALGSPGAAGASARKQRLWVVRT